MIKILAGQVGQLMNYSELASTLNVSFATVKNYLWYAQKVFLVELTSPYARNVREEISKSPVPLEVKYKRLKQDKVPKALRGFITRYNPDQAFVINLEMRKTIKINRTTLFFQPYQDLLHTTTVL